MESDCSGIPVLACRCSLHYSENQPTAQHHRAQVHSGSACLACSPMTVEPALPSSPRGWPVSSSLTRLDESGVARPRPQLDLLEVPCMATPTQPPQQPDEPSPRLLQAIRLFDTAVNARLALAVQSADSATADALGQLKVLAKRAILSLDDPDREFVATAFLALIPADAPSRRSSGHRRG